MSTKQFRLILIGLLALSVVAFGFIYVAGMSVLKKQSAKMVDLKLSNQTADAQLSNLQTSKKEIAKFSYFKSVAQSVLPNDKDQAQAVLDIFDLANQSGISLQSVTFPSSNLGVGSATTSTTSTNSTSAAAQAPAKKISQAQPVNGIPGLYSVQLTITPATGGQIPADKQVTYAKMLDFLNRIENNRRTAQITQVNIQPLTANGASQFNFSLTVNIFIKP